MYNKVLIIGNLGNAPDSRFTASGQAVTNFSVAANREYKSGNGERVKETAWFRIATWGRLAEVCNQYLNRGSLVFIEARVNVDPETGGPKIWTDRNGNAKASWDVTAMEVKFLSRNSDGSDTVHEYAQNEELDDDDIPF